MALAITLKAKGLFNDLSYDIDTSSTPAAYDLIGQIDAALVTDQDLTADTIVNWLDEAERLTARPAGQINNFKTTVRLSLGLIDSIGNGSAFVVGQGAVHHLPAA